MCVLACQSVLIMYIISNHIARYEKGKHTLYIKKICFILHLAQKGRTESDLDRDDCKAVVT